MSDNNGNGRGAATALGIYRTTLGIMVAIIGWVAMQIWTEIKDIRASVNSYAVTLGNHELRLERDETDIQKLDGRVTTIEIRR